MKINKQELEQIIAEEVANEFQENTSASNLKQNMRGQQMQKDVGAAGMGGRETIARLQKVMAAIGQQKMQSVPAPVKMALQKLEAAMGIQADASPEPQQGQQQQQTAPAAGQGVPQ